MQEEEGTVRFGLRLPKPLYEHLTTQAHKDNRSINSEIVGRLNESLKIERSFSNFTETLQRVTALEQELDAHAKAMQEKGGMVVNLPKEVVDFLRKASQASGATGLTLVDVYDELMRRIGTKNELE